MFKKFFNWIKNLFSPIKKFIKWIGDKKFEEFRRKMDIYYVPDDFFTNYDEYRKQYRYLYPEKENDHDSFYVKFNTVLFFDKCANAIFNAIVTLTTFIGFKFICKLIKA